MGFWNEKTCLRQSVVIHTIVSITEAPLKGIKIMRGILQFLGFG